jgi:hypothetical protein
VGRYRSRGSVELGLLVGQLALELVAAVERFLLVQLGLPQLRRNLGQLGVVVAALPRHHADVLALEFGQRAFGLSQLLLILLQLFLDEALRTGNVLARLAETGFDKNGQQRLHHLFRQIGIGVLIADGVEVLAPGVGNRDFARQTVQHRFSLLGRLGPDIQIGHARDLFQRRPADQLAGHQLDLLLDVRRHRKPRQQGLQQGLRIHVHAGRRLIAVGERHHPGPADDAHQPGHHDAPPAASPGGFGIGQNLLQH